mgnify:FL=1
MQQVLTPREQSLEWVVMCPDCSRMHIVTAYKEGSEGRQVAYADVSLAPVRCVRCSCPMDPGKAVKFSNDNAERASGLTGRPVVGVITPDPDDDEDDPDDE